MWESIVINAVLGVIRVAFKNPQKAAELKHVLVEIHNDIEGLYPDEFTQPTLPTLATGR